MFIEVELESRSGNKRTYAVLNVDEIISILPLPENENITVVSSLIGELPVREKFSELTGRINTIRPVSFKKRCLS